MEKEKSDYKEELHITLERVLRVENKFKIGDPYRGSGWNNAKRWETDQFIGANCDSIGIYVDVGAKKLVSYGLFKLKKVQEPLYLLLGCLSGIREKKLIFEQLGEKYDDLAKEFTEFIKQKLNLDLSLSRISRFEVFENQGAYFENTGGKIFSNTSIKF